MGLFSTRNDASNYDIEPSKKVNKKLYCIDFENTLDSGIIGISKLNGDDEVVIFYGSNNNSISFVSHEMIVLANCEVTIRKCDKSAKNYLDFQLVSYLGLRLGKEQFEKVVIVSKDTGFDAVVDFWRQEGIEVFRQEAIDETVKTPVVEKNKEVAKKKEKKQDSKPKKQAAKNSAKEIKQSEQKAQEKKPQESNKSSNKNSLPDGIKKKIRAAVKEENLKPTQYTIIYNTMLRSKTIDDYNTYINKRLGEKGGSVYEKTKNIYAEWNKN